MADLLKVNIYDPVSDKAANVSVNGDLHVTLDGESIALPADAATETTLLATKTSIESIGTVDSGNSTSTPLGIDGVFTGPAIDVTNYTSITLMIYADQASATDGLSMEFSIDGTNWDEKETHTHSAGATNTFTLEAHAKWFRLVYTNGGTGQGAFRLQTICRRSSPTGHIHGIESAVDSDDHAIMVHAILAAKNPSGDYGNINRTAGGNLKVSIEETESISDTPEFFEDTSFVTGDSPVTLDLNTALGRNATEGYIINDGAGNFTLAFSIDGAAFGDEITMKENEKISFKDISVDSLRITWIANSAYRVSVI